MRGLFDRDKWQEIFATISKNKLRTFLTALGVFWGIFMLVFLLGMGKGLENGVYKDFGARAKNIMYVWSSRTTLPHKGYKAGRLVPLELADLKLLKEKVEELDKIAPRNEIGQHPVVHGTASGEYTIRGELTDMPIIEAFKVTQGRYINHSDVTDARKVCVIGETVRDVLFGDDVAVGAHLTVRGVDFKVIGVYEPGQIKEWTREDMESVVIPLTTMSRAFGTGEYIDYMVCAAKPGYQVAQMEPKIREALKSIKSIHPDDSGGIGGFNLEEEFQQIQGLFIGIKGFLWFVGIGTLIAGIIGVSNIMLIIVKERTKEIGIRKALGATPGSIISMILTESVFITALSGFLGMALGTLIIGGLSYLLISNNIETENFYNPQVNPIVGITATIILVIAGLLAGLIPALQASKVNPVVALKDE